MPCNLAVCVLNFSSLSVHQKKKSGRSNLVLHFQFHVYNGGANIILNFFLVEKKGRGDYLWLTIFNMIQWNILKKELKKEKKDKLE